MGEREKEGWWMKCGPSAEHEKSLDLEQNKNRVEYP